ncbi:MAG: hypothetical protein ACLRJV_23860 [Eubacteriales bacterium]
MSEQAAAGSKNSVAASLPAFPFIFIDTGRRVPAGTGREMKTEKSGYIPERIEISGHFYGYWADKRKDKPSW